MGLFILIFVLIRCESDLFWPRCNLDQSRDRKQISKYSVYFSMNVVYRQLFFSVNKQVICVFYTGICIWRVCWSDHTSNRLLYDQQHSLQELAWFASICECRL